jgi:sodium/pantothenate symporter
MGEQGLAIYSWIILIAFIGLFLYLGRLGAKKSETMEDYAIAKGAVKPWMLGVCYGATYASANLFIGVPGWAYSYGETVLWWTWGCFALSWIGLILLTKKFWKMGQLSGGSLSLADWLGNRYNSNFLRMGVALLWLLGITYIAGQTVGMGTLFESTLGTPYLWGIILGTVVVIIYVGFGGSYADIVTDAIQGVLMIICGIVVFVSLAWTLGGGFGFLGNLHNQLNAISPALTAPLNPESSIFGDTFGIVGIELLLLGFVLLPQLMNKILALKNEGEMREFLWSSGISLFFMSNTMVFAGMGARILIPGLDFADSAVPQYLIYTFHPLISAFIVVAILAAVLSTTDGLYVSIATQLSNDCYRKVIAPKLHGDSEEAKAKAEKNALIMAKVLVPIIGIFAIFFAIQRPPSLTLLTQIGNSGLISGVIASLTLGYFWKRANRAGAIASFIAGTGTYIILYTTIQPVPFKALVFGTIAGFVAMIIVSLLTPPMPKEELEKFIPDKNI